MTNNIIAHNCVGGRICQQKGMRYGNPFMWSVIPPEDFYYLYTHYNELDYNKIKLEKIGTDYRVTIDGKVRVIYVHYKYDKNAKTPIKKTKIDVFYDKIDQYILEKYAIRLGRMKETPLFIVTDREFFSKPECNFKKEDLEKYVDKEDCLVVTCDKSIEGNNVIYVKNKKLDPEEIAKIIIKERGL